MKVNDTLVWHYNDDTGEHVSIFATVIKTNIKEQACFNSYFETAWVCHIVKNDSSYYDSLEEASKRHGVIPLYKIYLRTQYDEPIRVEKILIEYSTFVSRMCISAATQAKRKIV